MLNNNNFPQEKMLAISTNNLIIKFLFQLKAINSNSIQNFNN